MYYYLILLIFDYIVFIFFVMNQQLVYNYDKVQLSKFIYKNLQF